MRAAPEVFADALHHTLAVLPRHRNFRERESRVVELTRCHGDWFDGWRTSVIPARKIVTLPYAISWMWSESAQGLLAASPAWQGSAPARAKAAYRAFRDRLPPGAQAGLRSLVLGGGLG